MVTSSLSIEVENKVRKLKLNEIYAMDCVEGMINLIPDNSIDLVVTSPPYDNIRDYNGYSFDLHETANKFIEY